MFASDHANIQASFLSAIVYVLPEALYPHFSISCPASSTPALAETALLL